MKMIFIILGFHLVKEFLIKTHFFNKIKKKNNCKSLNYINQLINKYIKGSYIAKQLRLGKSVIIPKFGIFSFSVPFVNLEVNKIKKYNKYRILGSY